jgi:hypothetical protein
MSDDKAAYAIKEWCAEAGISHATFFKELKIGRGPRVAHMGRRTIVLESPRAFLRGLARSQARKPPGRSPKPGELAAAE